MLKSRVEGCCFFFVHINRTVLRSSLDSFSEMLQLAKVGHLYGAVVSETFLCGFGIGGARLRLRLWFCLRCGKPQGFNERSWPLHTSSV